MYAASHHHLMAALALALALLQGAYG